MPVSLISPLFGSCSLSSANVHQISTKLAHQISKKMLIHSELWGNVDTTRLENRHISKIWGFLCKCDHCLQHLHTTNLHLNMRTQMVWWLPNKDMHISSTIPKNTNWCLFLVISRQMVGHCFPSKTLVGH